MKISAKLSLIVLSGIVFVGCTTTDDPNQNTEVADDFVGETYTLGELAEFTGTDGNRCLVAVDGAVYEISGSGAWVDGQHTTSRGMAECGADLSAVIGQSPHGTSVLNSSVMSRVGTLSQ